ncbi:MAG: peptidoglycan DD-metalloendopeptidase family protein [Cytophagales bacterium]|nr:peptidoglycan DD-metalloendopeptidase family protein [Bernardetiaceae bacterium]MDW8210796.1 peptidoglycan DD-metalloendopeptidase family protein [Cytophagales bacterium]
MKKATNLLSLLEKYKDSFASVMPFSLKGEHIWHIDLTANNSSLLAINWRDTEVLSQYVFGQLQERNAIAAVGGYNEERFCYYRSPHFTLGNKPRTVHLGIDIWTYAGTPIAAPLPGKVHSFANNNRFGDYGYTIILEHELENCKFFTLYGHLAEQSLKELDEGKEIQAGQVFAWIGSPCENGSWPPHLHFQLITDMMGNKGDFPGVCAASHRHYWLALCPDPSILLGV